jgi:hypothetical protein
VLLAAVAAAPPASPAAAAASGTPYLSCRGAHPKTRTQNNASYTATRLAVKRMSCHDAAAAIRAGSVASTPGALVFRTPGFSCHAPVGAPPVPHRTRYWGCRRGHEAFRFRFVGVTD